MQYILYIIAIPFLYINYKIIASDIKQKIIPNKYLINLLYLIPFYYIYFLISSDAQINYLVFISQVILTLLISFILYSFWVWSAWDAKYLLVLSLFIPNIWVIPFIWNIALLTLVYLLVYFLYFYLWKCLFNLNYTKNLYKNIYIDLKEKFKNFLKHKNWWFYKKIIFINILKWIISFLAFFTIIRLSRIYLIDNIIDSY